MRDCFFNFRKQNTASPETLLIKNCCEKNHVRSPDVRKRDIPCIAWHAKVSHIKGKPAKWKTVLFCSTNMQHRIAPPVFFYRADSMSRCFEKNVTFDILFYPFNTVSKNNPVALKGSLLSSDASAAPHKNRSSISRVGSLLPPSGAMRWHWPLENGCEAAFKRESALRRRLRGNLRSEF